jgi:hypothetical protein
LVSGGGYGPVREKRLVSGGGAGPRNLKRLVSGGDDGPYLEKKLVNLEGSEREKLTSEVSKIDPIGGDCDLGGQNFGSARVGERPSWSLGRGRRVDQETKLVKLAKWPPTRAQEATVGPQG